MNPKSVKANIRARQPTREFTDENHEVMDEYYEVVENPLDEKLVGKMLQLIRKDPDFYDPYSVVAEYLESCGEKQKARALRLEAYQRANKRISNSHGDYPDKIEWGWLENRHIIRAIGGWARFLWEEGEDNEALEIYKKLFRANQNDNTGCRFDILAIKLGLPATFLEDNFSLGSGLLDAVKVDKWFNKNCRKFPEEFKLWFDLLKRDNN